MTKTVKSCLYQQLEMKLTQLLQLLVNVYVKKTLDSSCRVFSLHTYCCSSCSSAGLAQVRFNSTIHSLPRNLIESNSTNKLFAASVFIVNVHMGIQDMQTESTVHTYCETCPRTSKSSRVTTANFKFFIYKKKKHISVSSVSSNNIRSVQLDIHSTSDARQSV